MDKQDGEIENLETTQQYSLRSEFARNFSASMVKEDPKALHMTETDLEETMRVLNSARRFLLNSKQYDTA